MTKGQQAAKDTIKNLVLAGEGSISWEDLSGQVKASGARVKNWMTIRGVLQWWISHGYIRRSDDVHKEEYRTTGKKWTPDTD